MTYKILKVFENGMFTTLAETWKDIQGYEGQYQISNQGNVKSLARFAQGRSTSLPERVLKLKTSKGGYLVIGLSQDSKKTFFSVHRLVAQHFIPNTDDKPTVNHSDGVKTNNYVSNLEWATHKEQSVHAFANSLMELRGAPRYSPELKQQLLDEYVQTGVSICTLHKKYGISETTIGRIVKGEIEPKTKLSRADVPLIIEMRKTGKTLKSISEKFGCGISQIHRITRGESRNVQYERNTL